jgi:hypothetical protein
LDRPVSFSASVIARPPFGLDGMDAAHAAARAVGVERDLAARQASVALSQRSAKAQPSGSLSTAGGRPGIASSRLRPPPSSGTQAMSRDV